MGPCREARRRLSVRLGAKKASGRLKPRHTHRASPARVEGEVPARNQLLSHVEGARKPGMQTTGKPRDAFGSCRRVGAGPDIVGRRLSQRQEADKFARGPRDGLYRVTEVPGCSP